MSHPIVVTLPAGTHYICVCKKSKNKPYCDGSHEGTGRLPQVVEMKAEAEVGICACQRSHIQPFCDGSHKS